MLTSVQLEHVETIYFTEIYNLTNVAKKDRHIPCWYLLTISKEVPPGARTLNAP